MKKLIITEEEKKEILNKYVDNIDEKLLTYLKRHSPISVLSVDGFSKPFRRIRINDKEKSLVYLFYAQDVDGATLHESAPERPTARAAMMAANRALNKIVRKLGGWKPFKDADPKEKEEE